MSSNQINNYTILVSSCDAYEDLWCPFFTILKRYWNGVSTHPIVLNTETKQFSMEGLNIKTFQLYKKGQKDRWGDRLIKTLERINTKYVLFLLDDFFLTDKVDEDEIEKCIFRMEEDETIAVFYFVGGDGQSEEPSNIAGYNIKKADGKWRLNTQAAIWRKDLLESYIRPHESAWEWEIYGSERSVRYKEKFYIRKPDLPRVFSYRDDWGGAIHRGRWTPYAIELCKSMGLEVDFSLRGVENIAPPYDKRPEIENLSLMQRLFRPPFGKRIINYLKYLFVEKVREKIVRYKSLKE